MEEPQNKIIIIAPRSLDLAIFFAGTLLKKKEGKSSIKAIVCSTINGEQEKKETYKSAQIIGLDEVYFLKYKTGTLKTVGLDNVKQDIFEILHEEQPNQVLTVSMHGLSQNPNLKNTALAATLAYEKYVSTFKPENDDETENKFQCDLYYYVYPEESFKFYNSKGFLRKDEYGFDYECLADKKITNVIDYKKYTAQKIEALKAFGNDRFATAKFIEILKTYKSASMDYYMLAEKTGERNTPSKLEKISNRL